MSDLPAPLTPADCDLRDFAFMPLEVRRLLTSETWVLGTAEEKVAALCLWCEAWHQVPAASLPENERMLAHLSGAGGGWRKVREHALRGWIKCSDGRLYHPVVAEKALESWAKKEAQRERSRRANAARWGARNPPRDVSGGVEADREDAPSSVAGDPHAIPGASRKDASRIPQGLPATSHNDPKGQGQGEGEGIEIPPLAPSPGGDGGPGRPDGWKGQWRGLRASGSNPRAQAALAKKAAPPPPEPDHPLWPRCRALGMAAGEFRRWIAPLVEVASVDGVRVLVAPSRFHADHVRREFGTQHLAGFDVRANPEAAHG